ncbi:MAG: EamA family transporter, partial [Candidatus Heimdallarchaeaceae archaeon]
MDWVLFALLAPLFWACCNVIDKFLLEKRIRDAISYQIIITLFNTINIVILLLIAPISTNFYGFILGMIIGLLGIIAVTFYNKSMIYEEASRVVPLVYLSSIFVLILAYIFLGEVFNLEKYIGIIFIVIGGALISYKKIVKKWYFSSAVKFTLIAAFLWGASSVISKYTLGFIDFFTLTVWQLIGYLVFGPLFLLSRRVRRNFLKDIRKFDKKITILMVLNTLFYLIGLLSFFFAASIGMISLVYAIVSTQPFFIFIYMLLISKLAPQIIREK